MTDPLALSSSPQEETPLRVAVSNLRSDALFSNDYSRIYARAIPLLGPALAADDRPSLTELHYHIAVHYARQFKFELAEEHITNACSTCPESLGFSWLKAKCTYGKAYIFFMQEDYGRSIRSCYQGLKISNESDLIRGRFFHLLGTIYGKLGQLKKSSKYLHFSIGILEKNGLENKLSVEYANLAFVLNEAGFKDNAKKSYEKAFKLFKLDKDESSNYFCNALTGRAKIHFEENELRQAENLALRAFELQKDLSRPQVLTTLILLVDIQEKKGEKHKALCTLHKAKNISDWIGSFNDKIEIRKRLSEHYSETGKFKQALEIYYEIEEIQRNKISKESTKHFYSPIKNTVDIQNKANYEKQSGDLSFVVSHDLKEPLRSIGGFSDLISLKYGSLLPEEGKEYLAFMNSGVKKMNALLNDLQSYTHLDEQLTSPSKWCNTEEIIRNCIFALGDLIKVKNARISVEELPRIKSNPVVLERILINLIENALKFNDKEIPEASVSAKTENGMIHISVIDNGPGIEKDYNDKIFGIFKKLNRSNDDGTGIGLAICKKGTEGLGGEIRLDSEPGQGSCFTVILPCE